MEKSDLQKCFGGFGKILDIQIFSQNERNKFGIEC